MNGLFFLYFFGALWWYVVLCVCTQWVFKKIDRARQKRNRAEHLSNLERYRRGL